MKLFRPDRSTARIWLTNLLAVMGGVAMAALIVGAVLLLAGLIALAGATPAQASPSKLKPCDWSAPGAARYTGTTAQAVEDYLDMPPKARAEIRAKLDARPRRFDAVATITRDAITSGPDTYTNLRDMHWRGGLCRGPVSRAGWKPAARESGMVYCSGDHCIIVPAVCGNVARVDRVQRAAITADDPGLGGSGPASAGGVQRAGFAPGGHLPSSDDTFAQRSTAGAEDDEPALVREDHRPPAWPQQPGWSVIGGGGPCATCVPCPVPAVPEPETWAMFGAGLLALGFRARQQRNRV